MQQQNALELRSAVCMRCLTYFRLSIGFDSRNRIVKIVRSSLISVCAVVGLNQNPVQALKMPLTNPLDHLLNIRSTAHIAILLEIGAMFNVDTSP